VAGTTLALPAREHDVLEVLMLKQGKTVSKTALMKGVFSLSEEPSADAIEIYISRLRKKLEHSSAAIMTLRGWATCCARKMIDSLRLRLLWWLLIPMAVYVGLSTSDAYDNAVSSATLVQDRALLASARMMAGQVGWNDGAPVVSVPPAALELFASPAQDAVYYQVLMDDDTLLAGRPDFPPSPTLRRSTRSIPPPASRAGRCVW
jgi:two-component system sensor histidine kinase TctE